MATAKRVTPEPVPPPEDVIVLELTPKEAGYLKYGIAALSGSAYTINLDVWWALDGAGVDTLAPKS